MPPSGTVTSEAGHWPRAQEHRQAEAAVPSHAWHRAQHHWPHLLPGQREVLGAGRWVGQGGSGQASVGLTVCPASASPESGNTRLSSFLSGDMMSEGR